MPRYPAELPEAVTPFAAILINYMWNNRPPNRPPLAPGQLAIKVGVPPQSILNWVYRGSIPPLETVFRILAKLDIPLRDLYDAYYRAGLTVPRWDADDAHEPVIHEQEGTTRSRKSTKIPVDDIAPIVHDDAPAPRPYTPPQRQSPEQREADDWQRMIDQTADALRAEGLPEHAIEAAILHLRAQQSLPPDEQPIQRNLIAEHSAPSEPSAPSVQRDQADQAPSTPSTRGPRSTSGTGSSSGSGTGASSGSSSGATQKRRQEPRSAALR